MKENKNFLLFPEGKFTNITTICVLELLITKNKKTSLTVVRNQKVHLVNWLIKEYKKISNRCCLVLD